MSYYFTIDDGDVWNPSLRVGLLFVHLVNGVAEVLGVPSGLAPRGDDTCAVDPQAFSRFVEGLFDNYVTSRHPVGRVLVQGTLLASLVILVRAGLELPARVQSEKELMAEAGALARSM